jgi:hypothetical protein
VLQAVQNNASVYLHAVFVPSGASPNPSGKLLPRAGWVLVLLQLGDSTVLLGVAAEEVGFHRFEQSL